jgi:hypothetical protein
MLASPLECIAKVRSAVFWIAAGATADEIGVPELECAVSFAVEIEPAQGAPPEVDYRWDPDTDILTATIRPASVGEGLSGSVELMGLDGAWLNLDVNAGRVQGVEVAIWPEVQKVATLPLPGRVENGRVAVPLRRKGEDIGSVSIDTALFAVTDSAEQTIHFRLGPVRPVRTVRIARDLLFEVDPEGRIAGMWLLNVPPLPEPQ